ncbi:sugar ABC transporter substrate-binding protein [Clostridium polynesiense]|uniref:sugar ABC transporter substrate-binding protein n=1 Tax=Clostridium polynesiense TaxID=1325933 RepID=UPI000A61920B|nr:ABC transporter substrate-binding protein [Clostridium polynesiense]
MKKKMAVLLFIVFLFTGCFSDRKDIKNNEDSRLKGDLTIWAEEQYFSYLKDSSKRFKEKYPDININIVSKTEEEVNNKFIHNYNTAQEKPDIITMKSSFISAYSQNKDVLNPLTNLAGKYEKNFIKARLEEVKMENDYYGFPIDAKPAVLFYRKDILESIGFFPEDINSWKSVLEASEKLKLAAQNKKKIFGISSRDYNKLMALFANQCSMESYFKGDNIDTTISRYEKILSLIKALIETSNIGVYESEQEMIEGFKKGNIALIIGFPDYVQKLGSDNLPVGVKSLPAFEPGGNTSAQIPAYNLTISNYSKNKEAAEKFIEFALTDTQALADAMIKQGIFPVYTPVYNKEIFDSRIEALSKDKVYGIFEKTYKNSPSIKYNSYDFHIENIFHSSIENMVKGENVESVLNKLIKDMNELVIKKQPD